MFADEVRAVLEAKAAALVGRSAGDLMALIDPSFVYVNARGTKFDRQSYVESFCSSGRIVFNAQRFDDLDIRRFPGFAVAAMTVHDAFAANGKVVAATYRSLCVFSGAGDRWLWAAGQTMSV